MAKRKTKQEVVWIDWEVDEVTEMGGCEEYFQPVVSVECSGCFHPEQIINRDSDVLADIKSDMVEFEDRFYQDDFNFECRGYERGVKYLFKLAPFKNKQIKAEVKALELKHKGMYCPNCNGWYMDKDGNTARTLPDIQPGTICYICDEQREN